MSKVSANQLQTLQNTCLRICLKRECMSNVQELHKDANICLLSDRRLSHSNNLVYLGVKGKSTKGINSMFSMVQDVQDRTTRAGTNKLLVVPKCNLKKCEGNLRCRGPRNFNLLPLTIRQSPSVNSFKRAIRMQTV